MKLPSSDTEGAGLVVRPIDDRDLAHGSLVLGQRCNHSLPVAVAKFADQIGRELDAGWSLPPIDNRPMLGAAKEG